MSEAGERTCECGERLGAAGAELTLTRLSCPRCGREHVFSRFHKMDVALSESCNYRCIMCRRPEDPATLGMGEVVQVLREARGLGLEVVSFCGGEPFVHPHFVEIAAEAIRLGLKVQLTTNGGLVTRDKVERLRGLDCMTVSIDALAPTHDRIRGTAGAFDRAVAALNMAADAGIPRGTNTVIQRANAGEILDLFHFLLDATGGRLDYVRHAPVEVTPETADLMVAQEQTPVVAEQLGRIARECDRRGIYFSHRKQLLEHLPLFLDKWTRHRPLGGCKIPQRFIGYSSLGFYLCWHQLRSIRAPSLVEALESEVAREVVRDALAGRCRGCNAMTYSWDEEWNEAILAGKLVRDGALPGTSTSVHGSWQGGG